MTSTLPPLIQAFSGAIGSATANATSYPLDLASTRLQIVRAKDRPQGLQGAIHILSVVFRKRGWSGLYDGLVSDTGSTLLSNFCYFYIYSALRFLLLRRKQRTKGLSSLSVPEELAVGFFAGAGSRAVSSPLSLITVRLQSEKEKDAEDPESSGNGEDAEATVIGVARAIYTEEGLTGFWKGFRTNLVLCLNPSVTLCFYQLLSRITLRDKSRKNPGALQAFSVAALSNAFAVTLLFPIILAKTRLQASSGSVDSLQIWRDALQRDGIHGLFQGWQTQVSKGFLSQGLTMMVKQRIERAIVQIYQHSSRSL
ncbi:mitochondrial carrier [Sistotremastrum suecicum HHB10207 ss-3]|uniref:Mitochondrial carrier n=1 Tax=Sistotremastrum suecicum HHB10207 ss-3 TaxID=1314776 RepID=A0A166GP08_9AGAM|nr:mitochondrial carrier [Sistotremastrum suecicum HHB10207 ss-3]